MKYTITIAVFVLVTGLVQAKALPGVRGKSFMSQSFGRLPHFWGQEAVFTPEARRWLARLDLATKEGFYRPTVGIWDVFHGEDGEGGRISSEFLQDASVARVGQELQKELAANTSSTRLGWHGLYVTSVAVGAPPFGISVFGELNFLINRNRYTTGQIAEQIAGKIYRQDIYGSISGLDVLNVSLHRKGPKVDLSDVLPSYTTIVTAAGNESLRVEDSIDRFLKRPKPILVGAIDPRGEISDYSDDGHIYAPGDHRFPDGKRGDGTSLSAPTVSGALADMFAILPPTAITSLTAEPLDYNEFTKQYEFRNLIVHLLQETSTPMATNDENIRNGGILNHYKLLRVAHRIAQQASSGDQSVAQLIGDPRTYDFTAEARQLYEETVRLRNSGGNYSSQAVLSKLREAVALDALNQDARRALGAVYAQAGYTSLADFYGVPPILAARLQPRIHLTMDLEWGYSELFKASLLNLYAKEINTPQLVHRYLNKDLLLAMMWADSEEPMGWNKQDLPADNPWLSFNWFNPLLFIINYSKDVQQAKQLVDAMLKRFDISDEEKVTLTLPSLRRETLAEGNVLEEIISERRIEIDTDFLIRAYSYEARVARQLPMFAGQSLNLVEWSILHDSRELFAYNYEMLQEIIGYNVLGNSYTTVDEMSAADDLDDAYNLKLANEIAKELEGHINFTVKHTDNREALKKLLDLHKQVSPASEHQALLDSITPN